MLQAIVTATLSFVVFTFGSLLVAIQVASGQLTPRIIATTLLGNKVVKYTVALLLSTLLFAITVQNRIDATVHQLSAFVAACLGLLCFAAFLYLIDYASRLLRPVSILAHVGNDGIGVIENMYPDPSLCPAAPKPHCHELGTPDRVIRHEGTSGIVLAANLDALGAEAARLSGTIEFVPQVGDFVAVDEPLFNLYAGARQIDDDKLRGVVAFGSQRTMEQDPTFAFRIIVDIALRALSPAINDPTTAVLALDQLHRLLRTVGKRNLRTDEIFDISGQLRVIFRTPNWDDFVHLTFSEMRACGSSNLQIVRRLRAMIENLIRTRQLTVIRNRSRSYPCSTVRPRSTFNIPKNWHCARVADSQGLGGHSETTNH